MSLYAQQPSNSDSSVNTMSATAPTVYSGTLSKYGLSAELTVNGLTPLPPGVNNNIIGGLGFGVNLQRKIFIIKHNFFFSFGLGIATYDYATNAEIETYPFYPTPFAPPSLSYFAPIPDSVHYSKNKLNLVWLQVPLEFHLQTNPNRKGNKFEFALGVRPGYLINDHTKQKGTDSSGNTYKVKIYEIPNLDQFSTMVTAKIGYDHFNLFAYYNLLPLFVQNDIETTNEFGAGIALTL